MISSSARSRPGRWIPAHVRTGCPPAPGNDQDAAISSRERDSPISSRAFGSLLRQRPGRSAPGNGTSLEEQMLEKTFTQVHLDLDDRVSEQPAPFSISRRHRRVHLDLEHLDDHAPDVVETKQQFQGLLGVLAPRGQPLPASLDPYSQPWMHQATPCEESSSSN